MSWRTVVISSSSKLDYQMGFLVVRREEVTKIHLSEIQILIIESTAVSLTSALLCELQKQKIKVIFCDEKRNPCSELVGYYGSHDTSEKIRTQITWSEEVKKLVWTEIVAEKIRNQALLLHRLCKSEANLLDEYEKFSFSKNVEMIFNPMAIDCNDKKVLNTLFGQIKNTSVMS